MAYHKGKGEMNEYSRRDCLYENIKGKERKDVVMNKWLD